MNATRSAVRLFLEESRTSILGAGMADEGRGNDTPHRGVTMEEVADSEEDEVDSPSASSAEEGSDEEGETESEHDRGDPPLLRPSEYLRQRCPLCFGGKNFHDPSVM